MGSEYRSPLTLKSCLGYLRFSARGSSLGSAWRANLPFLLLLTLLLPPAVGPFTRFRFPLWSYFAYTALLAAELAYYLR
jgi:hypothetical protein